MATLKKYTEPNIRIMSVEQMLLQDVSNTGHNVTPPSGGGEEGDPGGGASKFLHIDNVWDD